MAQKRPMGRGLSAILSSESKIVASATEKGAKEIIGNIIELPLEDLIPMENQPRENFDAQSLEELAQSIKNLGIIQPLTVRKNGDKFQIISGERRYRASKMAGLEKVPCFIRLADDTQMLEMALVENIQREDLNAIEIAVTYQRLIDEIQLTQEELSKRVGKERSTITNYLRLLKLSPEAQASIIANEISMGHGRALLTLEDTTLQNQVLEKILRERLSVRETEKLVKKMLEPQSKKPMHKSVLPEYAAQSLQYFKEKIPLAIDIKSSGKGKGKVIISFSNQEEFEKIKQLFDK